MRRRNRFLLLCLSAFIICIWGNTTNWHINTFLSSSENFGDYFGGNIDDDSKYNGRSQSLFQRSGGEGTWLKKSKTVVLMWTKYYNVHDDQLMEFILLGRKWDPDCCSGEDILVTLDRSFIETATIVVFFNYIDNLHKADLPKTRLPGQLWVIFCKESPAYSLALTEYPDMFNWTMSYRLDSDIYSPYGLTIPLESPVPPEDPIIMPGDVPLSEWIDSKTDLISGVISNCKVPSQRKLLVNALGSIIPVDIYGGCGSHKICDRRDKSCDHAKFWGDLAANYKFYLAAENALCVDYITEKFWRTLELGMVPVVYGGANYSAVAPPNSYIDVSKFHSVEEVAEYLIKVADDPVEYSKYFEWRRKYTTRLTDGWGGWCTLCNLARKYNTNPAEMNVSPYKSYPDLVKWWHRAPPGYEKNACNGPPFPLPK